MLGVDPEAVAVNPGQGLDLLVRERAESRASLPADQFGRRQALISVIRLGLVA